MKSLGMPPTELGQETAESIQGLVEVLDYCKQVDQLCGGGVPGE